jgi:Domain of unknown function (DUF4386)
MMSPIERAAGVAGVLAGVGLALEAAFWMASGWTPRTFGDPAEALAFLRDSGTLLRAGVFAGAVNLVFATILIAGLAARLRSSAPTGAAATLHLGIVGIAGHSLVPIGLWLGVPAFLALAGQDVATAQGAWAGFAAFLAAAGGVGSLFIGLSTVATGWSAVSTGALPTALGWLGIATGVASVLGVLTVATPLAFLGSATYLPSLLLAIVFRTWAGIHLIRTGQPATLRR